MDFENQSDLYNLKPGEILETTQRIKKTSKSPPYITVGNGRSTKKFGPNDVVDAFQVFSELSKKQQEIFIALKDKLVQQQMSNHQQGRNPENPNLIILSKSTSEEHDQSIRKSMSQNKNGSTLQEKGILKQIKPGQYMLNPYIFIPAQDFERVEKIWKDI